VVVKLAVAQMCDVRRGDVVQRRPKGLTTPTPTLRLAVAALHEVRHTATTPPGAGTKTRAEAFERVERSMREEIRS
jgi:hypothetical protein